MSISTAAAEQPCFFPAFLLFSYSTLPTGYKKL